LIESGIYVLSDTPIVAEAIQEVLGVLDYAVEAESLPARYDEDPGTIGLTISPWGKGWTHVRYSREEPIRPLLEELVNYGGLGEMAYCHFKPDDHQYSYHLYRSGRMVESFSSGGSAMGAISFTSELRNVPLHRILDARRFLIESLEAFGMTVVPRREDSRSPAIEIRAVPQKTTPMGRLLRMLKG
jgi:hypothetical protein